jgi:hypothetical protein
VAIAAARRAEREAAAIRAIEDRDFAAIATCLRIAKITY